MTRGRTWRPLLGGEVRRRAVAAIEAIAAALRKPTAARAVRLAGRPESDPSLAGGSAGLALLYNYLARGGIEAGGPALADRFLEHAEKSVTTRQLAAGLYAGFPGVVWAGAHIEGAPPSPSADRYEEIDGTLLEYLGHAPSAYAYDLVIGLVGIGVYALERLPLKSAKAILDRVLRHLDSTAEQHGSGITWATPPSLLKLFPGKYNLGVAHGVPGIIGLLAATCHAGVAAKRSRKLLRGAVTWLLGQRLPAGDGRFAVATEGNDGDMASRAAWCYGDPGIAAVLWNAGIALSDRRLQGEALDLARFAARRAPERCGVEDAGLCHGAAGLGHIFNRLYQASDDRQLGAAARFWLGRCLGFRNPALGIGGFQAMIPDDSGVRVLTDDPGLLTGAAGIGLALLAAVTPVEPEWDRMLLLSMRGKHRRETSAGAAGKGGGGSGGKLRR